MPGCFFLTVHLLLSLAGRAVAGCSCCIFSLSDLVALRHSTFLLNLVTFSLHNSAQVSQTQIKIGVARPHSRVRRSSGDTSRSVGAEEDVLVMVDVIVNRMVIREGAQAVRDGGATVRCDGRG